MGTVSQAVIAAAGIALIVAAAVLAYGAKGWFTVSAVQAPESKGESAVLRYAPGSAQLSAIKVKPVEIFPVPLAEPLNGRVTFNETSTALVSSPIWVLIDLPERDLPKAVPGQPVSVEVDAWPGERFRARIDRIGVVVDSATGRVPVRCAVSDPQGKLKPDMHARVTLLANENLMAIRVPNTALVTEGQYSYVFVERSPGVFARRRVALAVQDRDYSYLESGIDAGERIVVAGSVLVDSELEAGQ